MTQRCSFAPHFDIKQPLRAVNSRTVARKEDPVQQDLYQTGYCKKSDVETVNLAVDVSEGDQPVREAGLECPRFRSEQSVDCDLSKSWVLFDRRGQESNERWRSKE